jgi:hypothetical protein
MRIKSFQLRTDPFPIRPRSVHTLGKIANVGVYARDLELCIRLWREVCGASGREDSSSPEAIPEENVPAMTVLFERSWAEDACTLLTRALNP